MLSESEVRKIYMREMRCFIKSGKDVFLDRMKVVGDILEIDSKEEERIFNDEYDKYHANDAT